MNESYKTYYVAKSDLAGYSVMSKFVSAEGTLVTRDSDMWGLSEAIEIARKQNLNEQAKAFGGRAQ